jgi:hypothetical protein
MKQMRVLGLWYSDGSLNLKCIHLSTCSLQVSLTAAAWATTLQIKFEFSQVSSSSICVHLVVVLDEARFMPLFYTWKYIMLKPP